MRIDDAFHNFLSHGGKTSWVEINRIEGYIHSEFAGKEKKQNSHFCETTDGRKISKILGNVVLTNKRF